MSETPIIRPASEADAAAIAQLLVDTWQSSFRGLVPDSFLAAMSVAEHEVRHRRRMRQPENRHLIAEDRHGRALGFANVGRNRIAECPAALELYALFVAAPHQGLGLGRRLVGAVAAACAAPGRKTMAVEALTANPSRGFLEHLGARRFGHRSLALGELAVPTVLYLWEDLTAIATPRTINPVRRRIVVIEGIARAPSPR
jgi:GNAT superfamily N-acetyltransferase